MLFYHIALGGERSMLIGYASIARHSEGLTLWIKEDGFRITLHGVSEVT